jgi:serine protease inhibitor ecotin
MKRHLGLFIIVAVVISFGSFTAAAEQAVIKDFQAEYITKGVTAEKVKGVEIKLTREIIRHDCNRRSISVNKALVSGDGDGWYDKYFMDAYITSTKMHCPLDKPVKEIISAGPFFIKSFTNENVDGKVIISVVIPKGYTLEATIVK